MKIYNQNKTEIIENPDLELGYLVQEKLFVQHHEAVAATPAKTVDEIAAEFTAQGKIIEEIRGEKYLIKQVFTNDGREVEKIKPMPAVPAIEAYDEFEDILIYKPYTDAELLEIEKDKLRAWREKYFNVIDRAAWYDSLTDDEKTEVKQFRRELLDITDTLEKPEIPECVREQINEN